MNRHLLIALFHFTVLVTAGVAWGELPDRQLEERIAYFISDRSEASDLSKEIARDMDAAARRLAPLVGAARIDDAAKLLLSQVCNNLDDKIALAGEGGAPFPLDATEIRRTVFGYELFKLESYLGSGVFPKRYFGYFDEKWDTGLRETVLLQLTHEVVGRINEYQAARERPVRLTDLEVHITYLAEGGARLLLDWQHFLEPERPGRIDLFYHHGCDNIGLALTLYPDLAARLDQEFGTELTDTDQKIGEGETGDVHVGITRTVGYRESIVANAIMYLFEKEIAWRKLAREEGREETDWRSYDLAALSLDEQFIVSSIVFNTGLLFTRNTVEKIRQFRTISDLYRVSERNVRIIGSGWRPRLPVERDNAAAFQSLLERGYPRQPTSWQGTYHALQRYGAFRAIRMFTDHFDDEGEWKGRPEVSN